MRANDRNIYQLRAYLQVQRVLYLLLLTSYVKALRETVETVAGEEGYTRADTTFRYAILPKRLIQPTLDLVKYLLSAKTVILPIKLKRPPASCDFGAWIVGECRCLGRI